MHPTAAATCVAALITLTACTTRVDSRAADGTGYGYSSATDVDSSATDVDGSSATAVDDSSATAVDGSSATAGYGSSATGRQGTGFQTAGPRGSATLDRIDVITTAVPWPRGVRYIDGELYALARGVHRSAGGPQIDIDDQAGTIFRIDPTVSEPAAHRPPANGVRDGRGASGFAPVGDAVRANATVLAEPAPSIFQLWNGQMPATADVLTDRPYCMLVYDEASQNFFVCGYSGIDLPEYPEFRKNATDSIHRFDKRIGEWRTVEAHDPNVVPVEELGVDVSSKYYPHHDIALNAPPHGLVNGPCGAVVVGDYLYVGAKDNTALAQYDLTEIRRNPDAPAPPGRFIFEGSTGSATIEVEGHGPMEVNGTCALATDGDYLYVSFRTTSQILRFPVAANGDLERPLRAQYIAQFPRYGEGPDGRRGGGSANIYDMAFDAEGRFYVSPGYDGAVYRFTPDPARVYDATSTSYAPYVDLEALVGAKRSGNICLDDAGNLYICSGQDVTPGVPTRGVIYRVRPE